MKKLIILLGLFLFLTNNSVGQDIKEKTSKIDQFVSKTGAIIKFIDYELPKLKFKTGIAESKVRKLISGGEVGYFHQISIKGKYKNKTASIAYEDILEMLKAIQVLKKEALGDSQLNPDYLENKFITEDGFQLGYYVSKGKLGWYVVLDKYGSDNTLFLNDPSNIENAFQEAKTKIEGLK